MEMNHFQYGVPDNNVRPKTNFHFKFCISVSVFVAIY